MNFFKIKDDKYLIEREVINNSDKIANEKAHHIWVWDRSGSMYNDLNRLTNDIIDKISIIKKGDYLSLGWFSGEGQNDFIVKGYKVGDDTSDLIKLLENANSTIGLTCFSEILNTVEKVIDSIRPLVGISSLVFFSDGHPVVSNYSKEIESIFDVIEKIKDKVDNSLVVGYGDYYNKPLMQEIAQRLSGSLTHANDIKTFSENLSDFNKSLTAGDKVKIKLQEPKGELFFSVFGNSVVTYKPVDGEVAFTIGKGKKDYIYTLTSTIPTKAKPVNLDKLGERSSFTKGMYGLSVALAQKGDVQLATDVLGELGDKKLIDLLYDSFTNTEYGKAEKEISIAMASPSKRFSDGKVKGYIKPEDAPCVLDALDVISEDEEAEFFPYAGAGYNRTGVKTEKDTDVEFIPENRGYNVSSLSWNSKRLNLSMTTEILGHVNLNEEAKKFNLSQEFKCKIFRSFTFIKDGILNIKEPVLLLSEKTHNYLKSIGVTSEDWDNKPTVYRLSELPVINRKYANNIKSVVPFSELAIKEAELKGVVKVLKDEVKTVAARAAEVNQKAYGTQIVEYLEKFHINAAKGTFQPPVKKGESTDYYMGKTFEIKIKGLSSLPKVDAVKKKIEAKKNLTTSDNIVAAGLKILESTPANKIEKEFIEKSIELRKTRAELLRNKFAIVMGKTWFDEFKGERLEEYKYNYGGYDLTFKLGETQVNY